MWVLLFAVITLVCTATAQDCVDGAGIYLLGTTYSCSHLLTNKMPQLGIYKMRHLICSEESPYPADCCQTCIEARKCVDEVNGVELAESYYNCKYLLKYYPEDEKVGIYQYRHRVCNMTSTQCCTNCKIVQKQPVPSTTTRTTMKPTTVVTDAPVTEALKDTCAVNCLWYADGSHGTCSWLTNSSSPAFSIRKMLCRQGHAPGCARSCEIVKNEVPTTAAKPTTTEPTTTAVPTTVQPTTEQPTTKGCSDSEYVRVGRMPYACTDLVNVLSNIYNDREALCNGAKVRGDCCASCLQVDNMKPTGIIRYGENTVLKPSDSIEIIQPEAAAQTQDKLIKYDDALKLMAEQQREAEQKVRDFMNAMLALFKSSFRG